MEPAPWIRDYVVDMEDLYTELSLEKIDKILFREKRRKLENYKELFVLHKPGILEYLDIRYYIPSLSPKRKILIKGDPGMGKTCLVKKIAYDWAKGDFNKMYMVLFVFLKSVNSDDHIESAILWQNPVLEGLHVTRPKLANILERFGPECLLILDGLDECAHGQNTQVHKIITGAKFLNCNVIVTSRPHSTRQFERYFDTIVSVEGFTRSEAGKFARRIVDDEGKVEQILNFNPAGERSNRPVHNVPILLSFLCLLVTEDNIDLSDKAISMGEIYFRMVQCLYKKFTIRKGIKFEISSLVNVLMSLGKFALDTLLSGDPLLERSKIIEDVGEEVFDYGLLIGQDGFSLTRDMTVDILVTFSHRSLQEFLGAFYFVLSLGKKQTVDKAVEEYLKNPLFLQFCLWFLDESNKVFTFPERSVASDILSRYTAEKIDDTSINFFELERKFPALGLALDVQNEFAVAMLEKVLKECGKPKDLAISTKHPVKLILTSLSDNVFKSLKFIKIQGEQEQVRQKAKKGSKLIPPESPLRFLHSVASSGPDIVVNEVSSTELNSDIFTSVLNICATRKRSVSVDLESHDPSQLLLPLLPTSLPSLLISSAKINSLKVITQANREHKLSSLCVLNIKGTSVAARLQVLLTWTYPSLTTLILSDCGLKEQDLASLASASVEGKLPQLKHLDISWNYFLLPVSLGKLFYTAFPKLTTLIARCRGLGANDLHCLSEANGARKLLHLTALDLTSNIDISGHISVLLCQTWSSLSILILRECKLKSGDLRSVAHASAENRLPQLKLLDISLNDIGYGSGMGEQPGPECLCNLLSHPFPSLAYLILCRCELSEHDLDSLVQAKLAGKLPALKYIDVSLNNLSDHLDHLTRDARTGRQVSWDKIVCFDNFLFDSCWLIRNRSKSRFRYLKLYKHEINHVYMSPNVPDLRERVV